MARLAFTTFAIMKQPYGDPVVAGFEDLTPLVFETAERAAGFVARAKETDARASVSNFERDWGEWGKFTVPRFYDGGFDSSTDTRASTLSLWVSIEAVRKFSYSGLHHHALSQRKQWFRSPAWPSYAMWWVADEEIPTWSDACRRLEYLHDHGSTEYAFTFAAPFPPPGGR